MPTKIEWSEEVWNPTTGCDRVSPGCDNCYIERTIPFRMEGRRFDEHGRMGVRLHPDRLDKPLHWRKPRRVFVNSLSDLFHESVPGDFTAEVFAVMALADQHQFQVLTKRSKWMAHRLNNDAWLDDVDSARLRRNPYRIMPDWPRPNIWLGTSIESDRYAFRADHLRHTPAAVRWLSLEPLLGPLPSLDLTGIDWVVVGGESGPGARPMHPDWARDIRDRCVRADVPFFFKQWGEWAPARGDEKDRMQGHVNVDGAYHTFQNPGFARPGAAPIGRFGKKAAGRVLDGRTWDQYPREVLR